MTDSLITVRAAVPTDLTYIDHLQRKNAEDLSFYPTAVFDREIIQQRIVLASVNGEPAQGPLLMLHWNTFSPMPKPVIAVVGLAGFTMLPLPDTRVH